MRSPSWPPEWSSRNRLRSETDARHSQNLHQSRRLRRRMARRGLPPVSDEILSKDDERRATLTELQGLQAEANTVSRSVATGELPTNDARSKTAQLRQNTASLDKEGRVSPGRDEAPPRGVA